MTKDQKGLVKHIEEVVNPWLKEETGLVINKDGIDFLVGLLEKGSCWETVDGIGFYAGIYMGDPLLKSRKTDVVWSVGGPRRITVHCAAAVTCFYCYGTNGEMIEAKPYWH